MANVLLASLVICALCYSGIHCFEEVVVKFQCDSGWVMFENKTCILVQNDGGTYNTSKRSCLRKGGQLVTLRSERKERFLYDTVLVKRRNYWIGLYRPRGSYNSFTWDIYGYRETLDRSNWASGQGLTYGTYQHKCAYIFTQQRKWHSTTDCDEEHSYVCEKKSRCTEGRFGVECDRFCHCHGETCDSVTGHCKYGCQSGWFGSRCDKEKVPAEVVFYCFNTTKLGPHMLLRINPHGVKYTAINGVDESDKPAFHCGIESFDVDSVTSVYSRVVHVGDTIDVCGAHMTRASTWQWKFRIQERIGVVSENDAIAVFKCDFSRADSMTRGSIQDMKGNVQTIVKNVDESKENVKLSIVDSFTGSEVKEIEVGAYVKLRLGLVSQEGSRAKAVSAYSCEAFSSDRSYNKQLTDSSGCPVQSSPVSSMHGVNGSAITDFFPMFTFPGISTVNFRCHYDYCFKSEEKCRDRCKSQSGKRRKRSHREVSKPAHTSVRVIARRQQENKDVEPPTDKYRGVPLLYLNPITCSMFLFLLTVFLLYYVFFIKSLKRSVEEMKQELHRQNRRGDLLL